MIRTTSDPPDADNVISGPACSTTDDIAERIGMSETPLMVGHGLVAPLNDSTVFLDLVFPLVEIDGRQYAWLDNDESGQRPLLVPSASITEFETLDTFEDYLSGEMHDSLGVPYLQLIWLVQEVADGHLRTDRAGNEPTGVPPVSAAARSLAHQLTPPSLLRCITLLHLEARELANAMSDALAWGDLLRQCDGTEQRSHALDLLTLASIPSE